MTSGGSGSRTRPPLWPELLLGLVVLGLYSIAAGLDSATRVAAAVRHGRRIFGIERFLHVDAEPALNRWLAPHAVLRTIANYGYASTYVIAAAALLIWAYVRRPEHYRTARTSFVLLNVLSIACFLVYPVAPPRLVPGLPFVDTVRVGHTWGSWGSPLVGHANQLAAMPSLHLAWALWVSVLLARVTRNRWLRFAGALHVAATLVVIMATANHYLLDAVGAALAVWLATRRPDPAKVPAADAFFLHVESPVAAQHVGGLAVLDDSDGRFSQESLRHTVQAHLADLPRFRQRLSGGTGRSRPSWADVPLASLDWAWHVPYHDLTRPDGTPGDDDDLNALVARLAAEALPRDRPLWRFVAVRGIDNHRAAAILVVHHVIADGIGTVAQAMEMLEPHLALPLPPDRRGPGPAKRASGTAVGLAQLATDGRPSFKLAWGDTATRVFTTVDLPLAEVRDVAHQHHTRVSDVLMTTVAGALRRTGAVDGTPHRSPYFGAADGHAGTPDAAVGAARPGDGDGVALESAAGSEIQAAVGSGAAARLEDQGGAARKSAAELGGHGGEGWESVAPAGGQDGVGREEGSSGGTAAGWESAAPSGDQSGEGSESAAALGDRGCAGLEGAAPLGDRGGVASEDSRRSGEQGDAVWESAAPLGDGGREGQQGVVGLEGAVHSSAGGRDSPTAVGGQGESRLGVAVSGGDGGEARSGGGAGAGAGRVGRRGGVGADKGRVGRRGGVGVGTGRRGGAGGPLLRVAVPLMVRAPGAAAEGNLTAAVMTDVPLGPLAEEQRLSEVARRSRGLYTGTRMLASNFVMRRVGAVMPVPVHAWFARTVYGGRFFQAIVSNMPGPSGQLSLAGGRLVGVYPILPLAPRAPLAVGALGWDGVLSVGVAADPVLVPDVGAFGEAMAEVFAELLATVEHAVPVSPAAAGVVRVPAQRAGDGAVVARGCPSV